MEQTTVVNEKLTTSNESELGKTQMEAEVKEETSASIQVGDKTEPNLLLKSLQEEREKRRVLEKQLEEELSKSSALSEDIYTDEGKVLKGKIDSLEMEISSLKDDRAKQDVLIAYPLLKDKWDELEEFRSQSDNKGMNLRTAAKAFLIENGLLETPRKGLEKPTGGPRTPFVSGMTVEDIKTLRETNFKKYREMLMKGQIKIE